MHRHEAILDSYQHSVYLGGENNESIESITPDPRGDSEEHSGEGNEAVTVRNVADEESRRDAGRPADRSSSKVEKGGRERRTSSGHGSAGRNEDTFAREGELKDRERGRASSGEPFEDDADNALFRTHRRSGSADRRHHKVSTDHRR